MMCRRCRGYVRQDKCSLASRCQSTSSCRAGGGTDRHTAVLRTSMAATISTVGVNGLAGTYDACVIRTPELTTLR